MASFKQTPLSPTITTLFFMLKLSLIILNLLICLFVFCLLLFFWDQTEREAAATQLCTNWGSTPLLHSTQQSSRWQPPSTSLPALMTFINEVPALWILMKLASPRRTQSVCLTPAVYMWSCFSDVCLRLDVKYLQMLSLNHQLLCVLIRCGQANMEKKKISILYFFYIKLDIPVLSSSLCFP